MATDYFAELNDLINRLDNDKGYSFARKDGKTIRDTVSIDRADRDKAVSWLQTMAILSDPRCVAMLYKSAKDIIEGNLHAREEVKAELTTPPEGQ